LKYLTNEEVTEVCELKIKLLEIKDALRDGIEEHFPNIQPMESVGIRERYQVVKYRNTALTLSL
jgi:hypothetical protein